MFNNIGSKIKSAAKAFCGLGIAASVISGISFIRVSKDAMPIGLLVAIVGSLISWVGSFALYGLGQLIDNSDYIVMKLGNIERQNAAGAPARQGNPQGGGWGNAAYTPAAANGGIGGARPNIANAAPVHAAPTNVAPVHAAPVHAAPTNVAPVYTAPASDERISIFCTSCGVKNSFARSEIAGEQKPICPMCGATIDVALMRRP